MPDESDVTMDSPLRAEVNLGDERADVLEAQKTPAPNAERRA